MITTVLYVTLALAFLVIAACLIAWVIQREPAGHGQHATRRSLDLDWDELPCFQPDPALAVHPDVQAGTLHNPGLLDDIRTERTTNLPGPDSQVRTDASALGWSDAQRQTSHQSAGEPDREIRVGPSGSWRSPDTSQLDERGVEALSDHLPGPVPTSKNGRAGEPRNLAGPVEQGQGHRAGEPATNVAMGNWRRRELAPAALTEDTTVDMSLHAAIRNDVDGDYTGQIIDRYFSQINLSKIFADLGLTYTRTVSA